MRLGASSKAVIGATIASGAACSALWLIHSGAALSRLNGLAWTEAATVGALLLATWLWPLLLYRGNQSQAFHMDEAFFVMLVLLLPPAVVVLEFLGATAIAQLVRKRPLTKSAFNVGQVTTSVGVALLVSRAMSGSVGASTPAAFGAACAGAVVYFLVNTGTVSALMVTLGSTWRACLMEDLSLQMTVFGGGLLFGSLAALTISTHSWTLAIATPALIALRLGVTAGFKAEHDRARVEGLFEATMQSNRTLSRDAVDDTIAAAAKSLLRCPDSYIATEEPERDWAVPIDCLSERRWLVAAGRRREEPFEGHDRGLLEALAAVASGASVNAELYSQVRYERQRLSSIALNIGEGVVAVDVNGRVTFANSAASRLISLPAPKVLVEDGSDPDSQAAPDFILEPLERCIARRDIVKDDNAVFLGPDGRPVAVAYSASPIIDGGQPVGGVIAFRDMTERQMLEDELRYQAQHDSLTGLANRRLLVDRLEQLLVESVSSCRRLAVVFIDVDRFKGVNDSLGHALGDDLLVEVSKRLQAAARPGDLLARFGGDEFVALLEVSHAEEALALARTMRAAVEHPIVLADGYELVATVSIGVALSAPGKTADDLLHDADVAMYHTKTHGRGGSVQLFDGASMATRSAVSVQLEADLRKAVDRDEIEVHYQPLCDLDTGRIVGAEALVRWRHPDLGLLQPAAFVGLAEETGLIVPIGHAVLEQAAAHAKTVEKVAGVALPISVNLSPRQFHHTALASDIAAVISHAGIDPSMITVEITESMVMDDLIRVSELMTQLRKIGISIAVDDFGVGHSSLGYLKKFPIQELKIDRSFVIDVVDDSVGQAIVRAVVQLADAMGVLPVAEGIETPEQVDALRALGCPVGQGYYFARPLPAEEFLALLDDRPAIALADRVPIPISVSRRGGPNRPRPRRRVGG
jgi:diguanylate cyclase (GGDEF)-like protein/PAS domain S-box-containing protein